MKIILFDIDNTILDFDKCAFSSMKAAFSQFKLKFTDDMYDVFKEINSGLWKQIQEGTLSKDGLYKIRWNMIFKRLGVVADGRKFEKLFLTFLSQSSVSVVGARDLLDYLLPKYTLCVASNAPFKEQVRRLTNADMIKYFKYLFMSEKIGHQKPTQEFFETCLSQIGPVEKEDVLMIGDSLSADINGANQYGIKTCWYNPNNYKLPRGTTATFVVNKLSDLKTIL